MTRPTVAFPIVIALTLAGCGREVQQDANSALSDPTSAATARPAPFQALAERKSLILNGDFESGDLGQFGGKEALPHELKIVTSPVRAGKYAMRVEVNEDEYGQGGGKWRAELTQNGAGGANQERERWFGFSTFLPNEWKKDSKSDIIFQIHERPSKCEDWRSPPFYLRVNGDKMQWVTRWDSKACSDGNEAEGTATVASSPVVKGRWVDWVAHVKWSYKSDGLIEIWRDGEKIATRSGPNSYNDDREMYLKVGNYKLGWGDGLTQRVHYVDEVRMGSGSATYADVAPGGESTSTPTPTPTPTPSPTPIPTPTPTPTPTPIPGNAPIGQTVTFKAVNGKWVATRSDSTLQATGSTVGDEDRYQVVDAGDGFVALKNVKYGKFVVVGGEGLLRAAADSIGDEGRYSWQDLGNGAFALKSKQSGKYVTADDAGDAPLMADRDEVKDWETFQFTVE